MLVLHERSGLRSVSDLSQAMFLLMFNLCSTRFLMLPFERQLYQCKPLSVLHDVPGDVSLLPDFCYYLLSACCIIENHGLPYAMFQVMFRICNEFIFNI